MLGWTKILNIAFVFVSLVHLSIISSLHLRYFERHEEDETSRDSRDLTG
jgi:hypothetical protein